MAAKKGKTRGHRHQAAPKLPAVVQMRKTEEFLDETERQAAKMRRLLWLAIKKGGGRIEFTEREYAEAVSGPAEERIVGVEACVVSPGGNDIAGFALVFQDSEGKRLPESEPGTIIITDR